MLQATQEQLKAAYRRLCMLYHPDKHRDPELKRQAEQLFNLVHEAYEGNELHVDSLKCWSRPAFLDTLLLLFVFI